MNHTVNLSTEEKMQSFFQADTLLPAEYAATYERKANLPPEKKLMLAVLEDAVACYRRYRMAPGPKGGVIFRQVEEWIMERGSERLFSFDSKCEILGFDPRYVRRGIMGWGHGNARGR